MHAFPRPLIAAVLAASVLLLTQCAGPSPSAGSRTSSGVTPPARPATPADISTQASTVSYQQRINQLLALADNTESPASEQYTLQASELAMDNDDIDAASAILGGLDNLAQLPVALRARAGFQRAELALKQSEASRALIVLNGSPFDRAEELDNASRQRMMRLRIDAFVMLGQPLAAAREHVRLAELLPEHQLDENNDHIWQILASAAPGSLQSQRALIDSYELRGWLELVNVVNSAQNNIEEQVRDVTAWQTRWNLHSASKRLPRALAFAAELLNNRPQRIALLIPLSEAAGKAVNEGFMAAYYEALSQNQPVPDIRVFDTSNTTDILPLYQQVSSSGVDLIIGPLRKDFVRTLQAQPVLQVPTLALNYGDEGRSNPDNLYQFGLAPEDEIYQAVQLAWQAGHRVATVMTPGGEDYRRIRETFEREWRALGGDVVANAAYTGSGSYSELIRQMMDIDDSEARAAQLRSILPRSNLVFTPRRRQDVGVMFLLANPSEGRQIKPAMAFHFAGDVAVYAMPAIYDGNSSSNANRDLNGVTFIDSPWLLTGDDPLRASVAGVLQNSSGPVERLRAMGVDSYRLHARVAQLANFPGVSMQGATGTLTMREDGSIKRELLAAQFVENAIILLTAGE